MFKNFYYHMVKLNKLYAISLIEVLITVAIVVVLMAISFNSITSLNVEGKRKEAHGELLKIKSIIEQLAVSGFVNNTPVNNIMDVAAIVQDQNFSNLKHYTINISVATNNRSYTLTAAAIEPLRTQDPSCQNIILEVNINNIETKRPTNCW